MFSLNTLFSYCWKEISKGYFIISFIIHDHFYFKVKTHKILLGFVLTLLWSKHIHLKVENCNSRNDNLSVRGGVCVFNIKVCKKVIKNAEAKRGAFQRLDRSSFLSSPLHSVPWRRNELVFSSRLLSQPSTFSQICCFPLNSSSFPVSPRELHSNRHSASPTKG